jgi:hypothetical protein
MLIEIESDAFRVPKVEFFRGLNVVIGDANAANSIGKSSFLMIIDFVFGGSSLLELNDDIVRNIGNHEYRFAFKFRGEMHNFTRSTSNPVVVTICDKSYSRIGELPLADYTKFLMQEYAPEIKGLSFRSMVGPYSRIWPKDNVTNVHRPLHAVASQPASECIDNLIKLFGRFGEIENASARFKVIEEQRKAWRKAEGVALIQKISKKEYLQNEAVLRQISEEVQEIKSDLAQYALNLRAIVDKEVMELAQDKDLLLREKSKITQRLVRTKQNIEENKHIKSSQLEALRQFFPDINIDKLAEIEEFHSSVARLLKKELVQTERSLTSELLSIDLAIAQIDAQVTDRLEGYSDPTIIVDRVYRLSEKWTSLKSINKNFEKRNSLDSEFVSAKQELGAAKLDVLAGMQVSINNWLEELVGEIYGSGGNAPNLVLKEGSYEYDITDDTGTGTAFANLVLFDLAVLSQTSLPFLIHDLPLFKNVEHDAVSGFVVEYAKAVNKQVFIALDEINKYGRSTSDILRARCVLELTEEDVLYKKKWRSR